MSVLGPADITDIKYCHDSVDKTLPNGSAKTNGCVSRNGGTGNVPSSSSPRACVRPCTGLYGGPSSTVVDCRYAHVTTSALPQVQLVNRFNCPFLNYQSYSEIDRSLCGNVIDCLTQWLLDTECWEIYYFLWYFIAKTEQKLNFDILIELQVLDSVC